MKPRRTRTQAELQSDSKTVRYELRNLTGTAMRFSSLPVTADDIDNNAYLESFAMHCRQLILFLFGHRSTIAANGQKATLAARNSDPIAIDFHAGWVHDCRPACEVLVRAKNRADKFVAHITDARREVNQLGSSKVSRWNLVSATSSICDAMDCFLAKAPVQNFHTDALREMREYIAEWRTWTTTLQSKSQPVGDPGLQLRPTTDARTITVNSAFKLHGRTE